MFFFLSKQIFPIFLDASSYYFYGNLFKTGKYFTSLKYDDCDSNVVKL